MDQSEDREEGVPPSKTTLSGEHENQTRDQRSSYIDLTQSDCREEPPPYETTETHNKRVENEVRMLTDLIKECKDSLKMRVKLTENKLRNMTDWIQESEDTLTEFVKLIWRHGESESDTNTKNSQLSALKSMKRCLEMLLKRIKVGLKYGTTGTCEKTSESLYPRGMKRCLEMLLKKIKVGLGVPPNVKTVQHSIKADCREKQPKYETTGTCEKTSESLYPRGMENNLSSMADRSKQHEDAMMAHMKSRKNKLSNMADWMKQREDVLMAQNKLMEIKLSNMVDLMKEREDVLMAQNKLMENKLSNMADLMKQREDALMAHIKLMDNKYSSMADWMKQREDVLMAHIKLMENKLSNMADCMKYREDAKMAHNKPKRLQEEGSDSAEPEPREEPSSHSDSGKSSCMSFSSDRSMNRPIDFKGSRPSALKNDRSNEHPIHF